MVKSKKKKQLTYSKKKIPFDKRCIAMLNALYYSNKEQRKSILRTADERLVKCICECVVNILHGTVAIKNIVKKRLKKYKNVLRQIASCCVTNQTGGGCTRGIAKGARSRNHWKTKKRILIQKGGVAFLPLLLAPLITTLFSRLFGSGVEGST